MVVGSMLAVAVFPALAQPSPEASKEQLAQRVLALEDRVEQLQQLVDVLLEERATRATSATPTTTVQAEATRPAEEAGSTVATETAFSTEVDTEAVIVADGPPPPSPTGSPYPQELLPKLGKIGASARLTVGSAASAAGFGRDQFFGGAATLPLRDLPGGRLNYELSVGMLRFDRPMERSARLLEIVPFSLVYAITALDRYRIRPYVGAGLGNYVTLQNAPTAGAALDTGFRFATGFDWRTTKDLSVGLDFRQNWVAPGFRYHILGPRLSFHF
jgi:hypothetical protein